MKVKLTSTFFCIFLLTSCAHNPTKGDMMMEASDNAKTLSKQWNQGNKLTSKGTSQYSKGLAMISDGEAEVTKGNKMIANGNQVSLNGKEQFNQGKNLQQQTENAFDEQYVEAAQ